MIACALHGRVNDEFNVLLISVIKHSVKSNFRKEELILAHSLKVWSILMEKG